uniref:Hemagglutinin glycoprotein n=1 Tax=Peste-des-petits-ruminants virus TaxID=2593991 RepID=A0A8F6YIP4_PPRV|nr:hemagglutinin [Peste des petits ruminants virus]
MSAQRERINAFYKDTPHNKNHRVTLDKERLTIERPYILLGVLLVMFLSLIGLLAIAGIRLHRATVGTAEIQGRLNTNIELTESIDHQTKDVLTPLFKIIGDEVGIRIPQRFSDLVKFISDKIKFLNPDREYDFRDLRWCMNPPERVKIDFDQFCEYKAADKSIEHIFELPLNRSKELRSLTLGPGTGCPGRAVTRAQFSELTLTLLDLDLNMKHNVSSVFTIVGEGLFGRTYTVWRSYAGNLSTASGLGHFLRVFEIGLVRDFGLSAPVFHMTNYLTVNMSDDYRSCLLAVGELKLTALCTHSETVTLSERGVPKREPLAVVILNLAGPTLGGELYSILPASDLMVEKLYFSSNRGIIKDNEANWVVPSTDVRDLQTKGECLVEACKTRPPSFCNGTELGPWSEGRIPAYGVIRVSLDVASDPDVVITSVFGPLIPHLSGMDLYNNPFSRAVWLAVPPYKQSFLGMINTIAFPSRAEVMPHILTTEIRGLRGRCHVPIELSRRIDDDIKIGSNMVVLPTKDLRYITATYDVSRSDHAIVYYIYDTGRSSSYFFPARLKLKGNPLSMRIECFPWHHKVWCYHDCLIYNTTTNEEVHTRGLTGIEVTCNPV